MFYNERSSGPSRSTPRRVDFPAGEGERRLAHEDYRHIVQCLIRHLSGWEPPPFIVEQELRRAPPPQWEKNLKRRRNDEEGMVELS